MTTCVQNVLENYVNNEAFGHDTEHLAKKLAAVANDLLNAVDELTSGGLSNIGFFTEDGKLENNPKGKSK